MKKIKIKNFEISNDNALCLIAGPCVIESRDHTLKIAELVNEICQQTKTNFIFKASFDKANRSSIQSVRGLTLEKSLEIFEEIKSKLNCPIITDIHNENQCVQISKSDIIDIIQIPAFLCRQTDLLIAAGNSKKIINVKKGQFLSPYDMKNVIDKIHTTNNNNILLQQLITNLGLGQNLNLPRDYIL